MNARAEQPRSASLVEAAVNVVVGSALAVLVQLLVFPVFGLQPTLAQNLKIGLIFTGVSLVRSYALRRLFEAVATRRALGQAQARPAAAPKERW